MCSQDTLLSFIADIVLRKRGSAHTHNLERVEVLSNQQVVLTDSNSDKLDQTIGAVGQIRDKLGGIKEAFEASDQRSSQALACLGDRLKNITSLSPEQSNILEAVLELFKQQVSANNQGKSGATVPTEVAEPCDDTDMDAKAHANLSGYDDLQASLSRLRHLAQEKQKTVFSAEADAIIHDVEHIFFTTLNAERDARSSKDSKGKRRRDSIESNSESDELEYQHEIKRIKGLLTTSHCVAVNDKGRSRMLHDPELLPLLILALS